MQSRVHVQPTRASAAMVSARACPAPPCTEHEQKERPESAFVCMGSRPMRACDHPVDRRQVLVDFYATWCGPCVMMAKELSTLSESMADTVISRALAPVCSLPVRSYPRFPWHVHCRQPSPRGIPHLGWGVALLETCCADAHHTVHATHATHAMHSHAPGTGVGSQDRH